MLTITFKDVGQGDSILLSWQSENVRKIGILDCRRYQGSNPILDEIKNINDYYEVEFLLVSHGHQDHISGFIELLNYFENKNINIKTLSSTIQPNQFQYFNLVSSLNERKRLVELINKINSLYELGVIEDVFPAYNERISFKINNSELTCLYPRQKEYNRLGNQIQKYITKKSSSKPDLNEVSTIFKINCENFYGLLTSDCTIQGLDYIFRKDKDVQENQLQLAQAPHHGSKYNHNQLFWKNRNRIKDCPVVFSSGTSKHNLPNREVVEDFYKYNYKIYSTNFVNGIKEMIENKETEPQIDYSYLFDNFTEKVSEFSLKDKSRFEGDKVFEINNHGITYIN